jgi:queuine tRNA-ribosyltransferase accessory subunit
MGNGSKFVAIYTSTGFQNVTVRQYADAIASLKPDVAVPLADLFHTSTMPPAKRMRRMVERTEEWIDEFFQTLTPDMLAESSTTIFAPVLPVPYPMQWDYLGHLSDELLGSISGLAIYDVDIVPEFVNYKPLLSLPRLSFDIPTSPHHILRQVSLGIDILSVPFLNSISDAGIALGFTFPPPENQSGRPLPLGMDMWSPEHQISLTPLVEGCNCYACTNHHRAFLQHLLNANEMLGWSLLQIHNYQVLSDFFSGIRTSLAGGDSKFEDDCRHFNAVYEPELPAGTGSRPRARGYHFKGEAGQDKINRPAWSRFDVDPVEGQTPDVAVEQALENGNDVAVTSIPLPEDQGTADLNESTVSPANNNKV